MTQLNSKKLEEWLLVFLFTGVRYDYAHAYANDYWTNQDIVIITLVMQLLVLTILHSEWPKLYGVLAILSAIGLT